VATLEYVKLMMAVWESFKTIMIAVTGMAKIDGGKVVI
jgi:hypothetical protein